MVRIGIIGMGAQAADHWKWISEVQRSGACQIVAAAVADPQNHAAAIEQLRGQGVNVFHSAAEMFDAMRGRMDAVTLPTPTATHAALMIAAVQSGYHVYLEKPPAGAIQEVDEMLAALKRTGRMCAVGFPSLWSQSLAFLKMRIGEGALGAIETITAAGGWIRQDRHYAGTDSPGRLRFGGGWVLDGCTNNSLADQLAGVLYLAHPQRHKLARPVAVRAEMYRGHAIEAEDTAGLEIFTAEGTKCFVLGTECIDDTWGPDLTIVASGATAYRSPLGQVSIRYGDGRIEQPVMDDAGQLIERFENFVAAVAGNDAALLRCHLEMCRPFVLAVDAAYESARQVRTIPAEHLRYAGKGGARKTVIDGIDAAIPQAASQGKLFSDLQLPWAKRTSTFDLTGYEKFSQQFVADSRAPAAAKDELPFG